VGIFKLGLIKTRKMKKKITLGYPYYGALYWLIAKEEEQKFYYRETYKGGHRYYKTLYGQHDQETINNCVSLSILFDEIHICAADTFIPSSDDQNKIGLNIFSDWKKMREFDLNDQEIKLHLKDPILQKYLPRDDVHSSRQIIRDCLSQNYIAEINGTSILCDQNYLGFYSRLKQIHNTVTKVDEIKNVENYLDGYNLITEIFSYQYKVNHISEFVELKGHELIKQYATEFHNQIKSYSKNGKIDELRLLNLMLEIIETNAIKESVSGKLGITASLSGLITLLGFINAPAAVAVAGIATILGVSTDVASKIFNRLKKDSLVQFAPKINEVLSVKRLNERIDELKKTK